MNISYSDLVDKVFKILKGLGFKVELYDINGTGPLSSPQIAKYIWTKPDGLMIKMPDENTSERKEITIYKPDSLSLDTFNNINTRIKNVAMIYGIGTTILTFDKPITLKDFSFEPKGRQEEEARKVEESINLPHLKNYIKN